VDDSWGTAQQRWVRCGTAVTLPLTLSNPNPNPIPNPNSNPNPNLNPNPNPYPNLNPNPDQLRRAALAAAGFTSTPLRTSTALRGW